MRRAAAIVIDIPLGLVALWDSDLIQRWDAGTVALDVVILLACCTAAWGWMR
ncbi:MAG: hypothetical protein KAX24_02250 [Anaerolineae bacterium]|nr:hypothetical protein [Anaerolineae bacterium]